MASKTLYFSSPDDIGKVPPVNRRQLAGMLSRLPELNATWQNHPSVTARCTWSVAVTFRDKQVQAIWLATRPSHGGVEAFAEVEAEVVK